MKVAIAVKGRFHAFDLARELHRHGALHRLLTTYPRRESRRFGIPDERVDTRIAQEIRRRARSKLWRGLQSEAAILGDYLRFERSAERWLPDDADVFVGWSGSSLAALKRAKQLGIATVVERGSTHVEWARETLIPVYEAAGLRPNVAPEAIARREVQEYEAADRIAIASKFVERTFVERGVPREKLLRVPYGVDVSAFDAAPGPSPDGVFRVLFVGAVCLRKGVLPLLEAFGRLGGPKELVLVGRVHPELDAHLARVADDVRIVGSVPQHTLVDHYARASVFCLPSYEEGFGMVVPQAMAAGRPVVASHPAADIVEDGRHGFVVAAGDVDALTERLDVLRVDPDLGVALGAAAKDVVATSYSWEAYGARMLAGYRELLGAEAPSPAP